MGRSAVSVILSVALLFGVANAWPKPPVCIDFSPLDTSYTLESFTAPAPPHTAVWEFGKGECANPSSICCTATINKFTIPSNEQCFNSGTTGVAYLIVGSKTQRLTDIHIKQESVVTVDNITYPTRYHMYIKSFSLTAADFAQGPILQLDLTTGCTSFDTLCTEGPLCKIRLIDDTTHCCPTLATAPPSPALPLPPSPSAPSTPSAPPKAPNVSCNCNSTAGLTPFSFAAETTSVLYPTKVNNMAANAITFMFVIGSGKGEGAKSSNATKAEFQVLATAKPYILGAFVNGEFRAPSWSKPYPKTARGNPGPALWYKVPFEVKNRSLPPLTPKTAIQVTLLVDAKVDLADYIPKDEGDGSDILYSISSVGAVDKKKLQFCPSDVAHV